MSMIIMNIKMNSMSMNIFNLNVKLNVEASISSSIIIIIIIIVNNSSSNSRGTGC